jgi:hypothetical protein
MTWGAGTDRLDLGHSVTTANMQFDVKTGGVFTWQVNGGAQMVLDATTLDLNQNSITDASFIALGSGTVATAGGIRAGADFGITGKTAALADASLLYWNLGGDNLLFIGSTVVAEMEFDIATGGKFYFVINAGEEYSLSATAFDGNQNSLSDWAFIELGGTGAAVATSGLIRTANNVSFWRGLTTGAATVELFNWGSGGTNTLFVGATSGITRIRHDLASTGTYDWFVNNGTGGAMVLAETSLTLRLGAAAQAATNGSLRVAHGFSLRGRDFADGTNANLVQWGAIANDRLDLGGSSGLSGMFFRLPSATTFSWEIDSVVEYTLSATGADFQGNSLTNVNIFSAEANNTVVLETAYLGSARRVTALNFGAAITTTQVPTNGGDLVTFIGNCATAPTAAPVSGGVLFVEAGALKWKDPAGITWDIAG